VAMHRRHHQIADEPGDVHSPNLHGTGVLGRVKGFIHSHFTWMVRHQYPNVLHYVPDLLDDKPVVWASRHYLWWIALGFAIPTLAAWAITGTVSGAIEGFLWGGVVRLFVVGQSISALNSVLHLVGTQRFRMRGEADNSRNNALLGALVWGEGWHNNHHAFPYSASFALSSYKLDISYWFIKTMERLALAWDVKVPTPEQLSARSARA
jgi:stearoyl-CoA desaturase (Delta-9 desaturase)